jgi:hypothetical protein
MSQLLTVDLDLLRIVPWPDEILDRFGHDPRSSYVEQYWLAVLGPSTTWLLRRLAAGLDACPDGFDLSLEDTARSLGLGSRGGRHSPLLRSLDRTIQFEAARSDRPGVLAVRRRLPPLSRRQVARLPPALQAAHESCQERRPYG